MKTILVTGGTGFIGSHTVVELQKAGYHAVIFDNLSNSDISVLEGIYRITGKHPFFCKVDLTHENELKAAFETIPQPDFVIHFAASKAVGESVHNPIKYYRNNLLSLMNLLDVMKGKGICSLVFSSSSTVYGQPDELPVKETTPLKRPSSPYGNTKKVSEEIIQDFCTSNPSFNAISLRYFNPVGADSSALIGELPKGIPNNLIPYITQTAAGLRKSLSIFGNDYPTRDGSAIRDYIHVTDLAIAHIKACERLSTPDRETNFETFNIGTGKGISVLEILKSFEHINGVKVPYSIEERRKGDVEAIYADTSTANEKLNWRAVKGLQEMMASAWKWQQHLTMKGKFL